MKAHISQWFCQDPEIYPIKSSPLVKLFVWWGNVFRVVGNVYLQVSTLVKFGSWPFPPPCVQQIHVWWPRFLMCPTKLVAKSMGFDYIQRPSTSPRSIRRFLETVHLKEPIAGYYFLLGLEVLRHGLSPKRLRPFSPRRTPKCWRNFGILWSPLGLFITPCQSLPCHERLRCCWLAS